MVKKNNEEIRGKVWRLCAGLFSGLIVTIFVYWINKLEKIMDELKI